jgi:bla regulator protein blaR1
MLKLCGTAILVAGALAAQSFEVASIRPHQSNSDSAPARLTGGRLQATLTLKYMIQDAYNVAPYQITGGPAWLDKDLWDITAKAEGFAGEIPLEQLRPMLRELIVDRFQLRIRTAKRTLPYLALRTERRGPKLKPSTAATPDFRIERGPVATFTKTSMSAFASWLPPWIPSNRAVLDETGLTGEYDFQLHWAPPPRTAPPEAAEPAGPTIFTALQEQLGLRLESKRGLISTIVVENAERPSEN